jgi:CheY-like chemotaxis protein
MQINVKDSGVGLSRDQVNKLFGDGVQFNVNDLQAGNGSGLGLYIAKGIVLQHGGTMNADSEGLGCGSTFTVTLPLYHIPDQSLPTDALVKFDRRLPSVSEASQEREDRYKTLRVLVVDDAVLNRKLLSRLLQNRGHVCDLAENGQEAVDLVHQSMTDGRPYDCILLDGVMPVMDGPTAATHIRLDLGCDTFIVGITGNVMPEDIDHFKHCGANGVLPKPVKLHDLEVLWMEYGLFATVHDDKLDV